MSIELSEPDVNGLGEAVAALRGWQSDASPLQLHPGDLGWFWRAGPEATATAVRTWSRDGRILAVGLLDGPGLLRLTIARDARRDEELARSMLADVTDPDRGVLPAGRASIEAPMTARLQDLLAGAGWHADEPWTPLHRDLAQPVPPPGVRVERVGPGLAAESTAVHRSAFDGSTFTEERWHTMAAGLPFADARTLLAYDDGGAAVACVTVWSAGAGRPGLLEPMGVHRDHRGRGHGRAISVAAAAALRDMGASSAMVCTPASNTAAVATYRAAGYEPRALVRDMTRDA
ncbi:GNAT family N-acetyltransferase [Streptomyces sp. NPDC057682]|uniref:GNAT family N-acetyltransferase n=1 Tax=Streptomyces sp. NPDC057682 TaxID=3346210 RepID=UPI0036C02C2F